MRFGIFTPIALAFAAGTAVSALPASSSQTASVSRRAEPKVGYLASNFLGGNIQSVYFSLSRGNDALSFRLLNGGQPVLTPAAGQGTGGARDPYLVASPDGKTFWQIATDLVSLSGGLLARSDAHPAYLHAGYRQDDVGRCRAYWQQSHLRVDVDKFGRLVSQRARDW